MYSQENLTQVEYVVPKNQSGESCQTNVVL